MPRRGRVRGRRGRVAIAPALGPFAVVVLLSASGMTWALPAAPATPISKIAWISSHIDHVVFLMQENHAYDNFYGTYCQTTSAVCPTTGNGIPSGTCVVKYPTKPTLGCVRPYNLSASQMTPPDMSHVWSASHVAVNNGSMNGFYVAEGGKSNETFGHYNGSTIPVAWDLAEEYALADNFFSGSLSYSLANHWYQVAAMPPTQIQTWPVGIPPNETDYLNESNRTPNVESTLLNSSISWDWYDWALPATYQQAITVNTTNVPKAFDLWNPLAARAQSYQATPRTHFLPRSSFFSDAANGTLPNISWVIPSSAESDHPPMNLTVGENWIASVVDALETSPEWNSTLLFVSWDEYGGWYDHVAPPVLDAYGAGIRVPLLAIGPWVKQGWIDHTQMNFDSVLHLMEKRFGLKCLGKRDCQAALPLGIFSYSRLRPRAPIIFPDNGTAVYPMPVQLHTKHPGALGFVPFDVETPPPSAEAAAVLDWN